MWIKSTFVIITDPQTRFAKTTSVCVHVCVFTSKIVTVKQTIWEAVKLNTFFMKDFSFYKSSLKEIQKKIYEVLVHSLVQKFIISN